jgi:hypothetical protein
VAFVDMADDGSGQVGRDGSDYDRRRDRDDDRDDNRDDRHSRGRRAGEISLADVDVLFSTLVADRVLTSLGMKGVRSELNRLQRSEDDGGRGHRSSDPISFPEVLAAFGFVFEELKGGHSVESAFAMVRLHAAPGDVRRCAEKIAWYLNRAIEYPHDPGTTNLRCDDDAFATAIGRVRGGVELMVAVGFEQRPTRKGTQVMIFGGDPKGDRMGGMGGGKEGRAKLLQQRKEELDRMLLALDGQTQTIGAVLRSMRDHPPPNAPTQEDLRSAVDLCRTYIVNIVKNTKDHRLWRIREINPVFSRRVGRLPGAVNLMDAIGFQLTSTPQGGVFVIKGAPLEDMPAPGSLQAVQGNQKKGRSGMFSFPELPSEVEASLWRRKVELDAALEALENGTFGPAAKHVDNFLTAGGAEITLVPPLNQSGGIPRKGGKGRAGKKGGARGRSLSPRGGGTAGEGTLGSTDNTVNGQSLTLNKYLTGKTKIQQAQLNMMSAAFSAFDRQGAGRITAPDVRAAFRTMGRSTTDGEVVRWIKDRDISQDGTVSFPEFVASLGATLQPEPSTWNGVPSNDPDPHLFGHIRLDKTGAGLGIGHAEIRAGGDAGADRGGAATMPTALGKPFGAGKKGRGRGAGGGQGGGRSSGAEAAIAAAVGALCLWHTVDQITACLAKVIALVQGALDAPAIAAYTNVDAADYAFSVAVGNLRGGPALMAAVGYVH